MSAALQTANDPATAPTVPGHGSTKSGKDQEMNKHSNITAQPAPASTPLTMDDVHKEFEAIWSDILEVQRKSYLLMHDLEFGLDVNRGRKNDVGISLIFQPRGIDVSLWLVGQVWSDCASLEEKADALIHRLEGAIQ